MKKKVVLVKTNLLNIDPRLYKEVDALIRHGYSVTLLTWDRECKQANHNTPIKSDEIIMKFRAPRGMKILFYLPIWWCFVFLKLLTVKYDIVHAINFDTLLPSLLVAKLKKKSLIYEIFDVYADIRKLPNVIRVFGLNLEKLLLRPANYIILANEGQRAEMNGVPNKNIIEIFNSPPDVFNGLKNNTTDEPFTIFFAGAIYNDRRANIENVCQAILEIDNAKIIIAGYGDKINEIQKLALSNPNKIEFLGTIKYDEVLKMTMASDLTFALYDPIILTTRYAGCNKLFEAMMAGKPILVVKGTMMAKIVNREQCGLVIDSCETNKIKQAIIKLKGDPDLCFQLGLNGRKAYELKYNWKIMQDRLIKAYDTI